MNPNLQQQQQQQGQQPMQGQPQGEQQPVQQNNGLKHWLILLGLIVFLVMRSDPILQLASELKISATQTLLKKDEKADLQKFEITDTSKLYESCVFYNKQRQSKTDPNEITKAAKKAIKNTLTEIIPSSDKKNTEQTNAQTERKVNKTHLVEYQCGGWATSIPEIRG